MSHPHRSPLRWPDPHLRIAARDRNVVPDVVREQVRVIRVDFPTPDAAVLIKSDNVIVLADHRVTAEHVERLRLGAQLLAQLPRPHDPDAER